MALSRSSGTRLLLGLILVVEVIGVVAGAWFFAETRNTLLRNGRWGSTKERLEMPVMASRAYLTDRHALAFGELDLGAWHGYQEVLWKDRIDPRRIEFDFLLTPSSYMAFLFGHNGNRFDGLRISAHGHFKHHFLTGVPTGEFTSAKAIALPELDKSDWIHLEALFEDGAVQISLNGKAIKPHKVELPPKWHFGFRCGQKPVLIDNVEFELKDGHIVRESFTNHRDLKLALLLGFAALVVLNALIFGIARFSPALRRNWKKLAVSGVVTAILLVAAAFFLRERFSRSYSKPTASKEDNWRKAHTEEVVEAIEQEHSAPASETAGATTAVPEQRAQPPEEPPIRVLLIGTSQTWGSGASRKSEGLVPTLQRLLNTDDADPRRWLCINGGVASSRSYLLLDLYKERWLRLNPDAVVINLSNNDSGRPKKFEQALEEFVAINQERGIPTLFVLEATSIERRMEGLPLHAVMNKVAKKHDLPVLDMHAWTKAHSRRGFLWWDTIHPTSFGHRLIAERLLEPVRALLD